ncbi:cytochrome c oxidase accessory protein CcoG [Polynucleobacter sp. MWH-Spelu-300-X4]|uniref:cytochrome c oxidase accessory protein CcoG n=1 Tax=Polynucleobacter sp. MWH-Spelu-300-X4 TaxID=2689109 RepID=UPI001BFD952D|nr:cytochrome c oxidase accessory protein CcoG [Polynucleobacter sp. MWH-Spelu-300-X4]QWD80409.1 cytochrome c oxidase accessory protein CcoG [Polynucleobacter sp. MWH-Spelu-300-X4]
MSNSVPEEEGNSSNTVELSLYEVRRKIYPRSVSGVFAKWRLILVAATQLLFYGLPWITWNGRQAVLFDLLSRKFYIFGLVLWPQDIIYLTLLLILSALALFLFTAVAGRLFCGYACPQTVYTEIFMWIERKVEGDRFARIRLDGEDWPWSFRKWRIKLTKHALWILVALWTGFTFVGYFTPMQELSAAVMSATLGPWQAFWLFFYSFATWGNAGFMREQVCKYMCPYARFQSVMVDKDTFVVTYDKTRGEPRGSRSKSADHKELGLGDCVDCSICVQVCPTGIDIRDGLQYMCIGCGACIDACNQVMDKVGYPQGLVRYTSERAMLENIDNKKARHYIFRPRVMIYIGIMAVLMTAFAVSLFMRNPLRVDVMRDRGALAREIEGTKIENVYRLQIMNSSENPMRVTVAATGLPGMQVLDSQGKEVGELVVNSSSNLLIPVKVRVLIDDVKTGNYQIHFDVQAKEEGSNASEAIRVRDEKSSFIVPR